MENSSLNKAHQQHRKAETLLRHRKFSDAIECHKTAADLLSEALTLTTNSHSLESLKLQRDFHLRQKDVILIKKEQFENYRKAVENQRQRQEKLNFLCSNGYEDDQDNESISLQAAIYRTMEETDSLLGLLVKKGSAANSDSESLKSFSTTDTDDRGLDIIDCPNTVALLGSKHPKDDTTVIEELRILNGQLHTLVYQLVTQLDARTKEVDKLQETISRLESEKGKVPSKSSNSLKVITDSSGGTSPYVFSPCSELSPDVHDTRILPPLTPLELPNFDIANFVKNNTNPVNSAN